MTPEKILVVDDSSPVTKIVSVVARRAGYQTHIAKSLAEVEHILNDEIDFSCACVDYNLPDAQNGEAIDLVLTHDIPTFVLTGSLNEEIRKSILSRPVIDYIPKETIQTFDYISRLLNRLRDNKHVKILVVDDARSSRTFMKALLNRHNFKVLEAEDGVEALKVLEAHPDVKIVITDNEMPNMTGIELVSKLRQQYDNDRMAIIGVSGSQASSLSARFLKSGANDFLTKPFGHEEFYTRIFRNIEYIENVNQAKNAANQDFLTGLINRRAFFETTTDLVQASLNNEESCAISLFDLDHFKAINDNYGHDAGDKVLCEFSNLMRQFFSEQHAYIARFGGEEFCLCFINTPYESLSPLLEQFRIELSQLSIDIGQGEKIGVRTSMGLSRIEHSLDAAISEADRALYLAKERGRDQLVTV